MEKIHFPKDKFDIFKILAMYNIPKSYYHPHIEIISYSKNEVTKQELVNIKYWKHAKTLHGQTGSVVYIINEGLEPTYNVSIPKPYSEFIYLERISECPEQY